VEQFALSFANEFSGKLDQEANELPGYTTHALAHRPLLSADSVFGRQCGFIPSF
jgi:hypothetical protein